MMRIDTTVLVPGSTGDLYRYLSDPRTLLSRWSGPLNLVKTTEVRSGLRHFELRIGRRDRWDVEVEDQEPGRRLRIGFQRRGKSSGGSVSYELQPHEGGTLLRTAGEVRVGLALRLMNALARRPGQHPAGALDHALEARIARWIADNPRDNELDTR